MRDASTKISLSAATRTQSWSEKCVVKYTNFHGDSTINEILF